AGTTSSGMVGTSRNRFQSVKRSRYSMDSEFRHPAGPDIRYSTDPESTDTGGTCGGRPADTTRNHGRARPKAPDSQLLRDCGRLCRHHTSPAAGRRAVHDEDEEDDKEKIDGLKRGFRDVIDKQRHDVRGSEPGKIQFGHIQIVRFRANLPSLLNGPKSRDDHRH